MSLEVLDPVLVLTPLLALAVVLLLGFAGCDLVFRIDPVVLPTPFLTLRVLIPMALDVREIVFRWDPPDAVGDSKPLTKPDPTGVEGSDNVFDHELTGEPVPGSWTAYCKVTVAGGSQQGVEGMSEPFTLDESHSEPVATFRAVGDAANLQVVFVGVA